MTEREHQLEALARQHGRRVLAYLARRSANADDAADVFQAVMLVTWRRLDDLPTDDAMTLAWLLGTARRCLATHRRSDRRRLRATEHLRTFIRLPTPAEADLDERVIALREALTKLTKADQELLTLIYWEELSSDQVAVVLEVKPETVRKRVERARTRLRLQLEAEISGSRALSP